MSDQRFIAKALRNVLPSHGDLCVQRRRHARITSFQAAIWAGAIATSLGASPSAVTRIRCATRGQAFALWSGSAVPRWAAVPTTWGAVTDVALMFASALAPFEGQPKTPNASLRELLKSPDPARHAAACALAESLGFTFENAKLSFGRARRAHISGTME